MRYSKEVIGCDLCDQSKTEEPTAVPLGWVRFWDSGPHGMDDKERIVCEQCLQAIKQAKGKG